MYCSHFIRVLQYLFCPSHVQQGLDCPRVGPVGQPVSVVPVLALVVLGREVELPLQPADDLREDAGHLPGANGEVADATGGHVHRGGRQVGCVQREGRKDIAVGNYLLVLFIMFYFPDLQTMQHANSARDSLLPLALINGIC